MIRAVLDTNVIVSAALSPSGPPSQILEMADQRIVQLWLSPSILAEYREVLARIKVGVLPARARTMLNLLRAMSRSISPNKTVDISPDPDDNMFLECAEAAKAHYLVTGNSRHFPARWKYTRIVTPKKFIDILAGLTQPVRRK
jgi:uncharacterized protein